MLEDTELLRRYAESRSEEAFAELVQRRIGLVYSVALRRTRSPQRAEDVAQTVFADLARKAAVLSRRPALAGWLYRSAHFAAATLMRGERNRTARETEAQLMHEITRDDDSEQDWEKTRPLLDEVLSELDERDRDALLLRFFDDRTFAEIGRRLEVTENAARMRVERALDKFHGLLSRRGVKSTSAALGVVLAQQAVAATSAPVGLAAAVTGTALSTVGAAATVPLAKVIYFMKAQKLAAGVAGLVLAAAVGTVASDVYADREFSRRLFADQKNTDALARFHALQRRAVETERLASERQVVLAKARADQAARKARLASAAQLLQEANKAKADAFIARHPDVKAAAIRSRRMANAGNYRALFKKLGLSADQIERFLDLSVQISGGSLKQPDGSFLSYSLGDAATARKQLRELLGDDGYKQFEEYFMDLGRTFSTATRVAGGMYRSSTPITPEQGERLQQILVEGQVPVAWSGRPEYAWDEIMAKARTILSDAQLEALGHERAQDEFSQAFTQSRLSADAVRPSAVPGK